MEENNCYRYNYCIEWLWDVKLKTNLTKLPTYNVQIFLF